MTALTAQKALDAEILALGVARFREAPKECRHINFPPCGGRAVEIANHGHLLRAGETRPHGSGGEGSDDNSRRLHDWR